MSEAGAAKAQTGKSGGGINPPPPDRPSEWKTLTVILQYKDAGGVFEYRAKGALPAGLREDLHERHGIGFATYEEK